MSKTRSQLEVIRKELINKIKVMTAEQLNWKKMVLHPCYGGLMSPFGVIPVPTVAPVVIDVCEVVTVKIKGEDIYVPVTATETFDFAAQFQAFPLTRAVADQLFIHAKSPLSFHAQNPPIQPTTENPKDDPVFIKALSEELADFEEQSAYLRDNNYKGIDDFGAHKLWILSNYKVENACRPVKDEKARAACLAKDDGAVNYGFYKKKQAGDISIGGPFLHTYKPKNNLKQDRGGRHDAEHWDYSQLLQLMRDSSLPIPFVDKITGQTTFMDMRTALLKGHPLLWDEQVELTEADLPSGGPIQRLFSGLTQKFF